MSSHRPHLLRQSAADDDDHSSVSSIIEPGGDMDPNSEQELTVTAEALYNRHVTSPRMATRSLSPRSPTASPSPPPQSPPSQSPHQPNLIAQMCINHQVGPSIPNIDSITTTSIRGSSLNTSSISGASMHTAVSASNTNATPASSDADSSDESNDDDLEKHADVSMTSSVQNHVFEGGIRYHAYRAGKYPLPNDETEQARDDMKHAMTLGLMGEELFYAPVEERLATPGAQVLDLGTGTGIWAIELGDRFPTSTITGVDLSPIQPSFVPHNVSFYVDDFEEEWVDSDEKYDFIHMRYTLFAVYDPITLVNRIYRHLKPGAYFEAQELLYVPNSDDNTLTPSTPYALRDYINYMAAGLRVIGTDLHAILSLPDIMRQAGFVDVRVIKHKVPIGPWPRDDAPKAVGSLMKKAILEGLRGVSRKPLLALAWQRVQIEIFLMEVRQALMRSDLHAYFTLHVVVGKKPE